jgi:hypothetical protein
LKDGGRAISGSRSQQRVRRGLVAGQVALSVLLLAGAALLLASFNRLSHEKMGFNPKGFGSLESVCPQRIIQTTDRKGVS